MSDLIGVTMAPSQLRAAPGEEVQASIEVQNVGRVVDAYAVAVEGLPDDWYALEKDSVSLFPGDVEAVGLRFRIPGGSGALAGVYNMTVRVSSTVYPGEETAVQHELRVEPTADFVSTIRPELVAGPSGEYTITVTNTGNTETILDLGGTDAEGICRFSFIPNPLAMAPGEVVECKALVKPGRRPLLEPARRYDLTFTLTPRQISERATLSARLEVVLPAGASGPASPGLVFLLCLLVLFRKKRPDVLER